MFPSPSLPIILPSSADNSPTANTPTVPSIPASIPAPPAPLVAPVPMHQGFPFVAPDAVALLQTVLDHYRLLEEAANNSNSSSPSKDDDSGDEESEGLNSNCIIDVCTVWSYFCRPPNFCCIIRGPLSSLSFHLSCPTLRPLLLISTFRPFYLDCDYSAPCDCHLNPSMSPSLS